MPNPHAASARRHPCVRCLLGWIALLLVPVTVAILTSTPGLLLFALPPVAWVALLASLVLRGAPTGSEEEAQRLDRMLVEVGGTDAFLVGTRDDVDWPIFERPGARPLLIAATDFVRHASDEALRGVAALQHAGLPRGAGNESLFNITSAIWMVTLIAAYLATAMADGAGGPLPALSVVGFSVWLVGAGHAAWLALKTGPESYAALDRRAAELAGDPRHVADALLAMRTWQRLRDKKVSPAIRLSRTAIRPIEPGRYELERASALLKQAG